MKATLPRPCTMGPPRKFYTLNATGQAELATFWVKWDYVSLKINELKGERAWKTS